MEVISWALHSALAQNISPHSDHYNNSTDLIVDFKVLASALPAIADDHLLRVMLFGT